MNKRLCSNLDLRLVQVVSVHATQKLEGLHSLQAFGKGLDEGQRQSSSAQLAVCKLQLRGAQAAAWQSSSS